MTEYTPEYIQSIASVEDMPAVAKSIVEDYCMHNDIDEKDIYPSIWNDIITELYIKLFAPCHNILRLKGGIHNEYDISKVEYIYNNIYKRLCNSHCQEITLKGFLDMTGISKQSIYDWSSGVLSSQRSDLHEKIMQDNEESLFSLMKDRRNNPMKYLPKLNKVHNWNMPGVSSRQTEKGALTAAELPQLGQNNPVLIDKSTDQAD